MAVIVKLKSADFFDANDDHVFHFDLVDDGRPIGKIDVATANVAGGMSAVHDRSLDNLIAILEGGASYLRALRGA